MTKELPQTIKSGALYYLCHFMHRTIFLLAIELAFAGGMSFYVGTKVSWVFGVKFAPIGGLWSAISAYYILNLNDRGSILASWNRALGIFIGVLIAGAISSGLHYTVESLMLSLLVAVMLVAVIGKAVCFRTTCISLTVIYLVGILQPDIGVWWNCLGRFCESAVGMLIALIVIIVFHPVYLWLCDLKRRCGIKGD